jgi:chaperonin GroEL
MERIKNIEIGLESRTKLLKGVEKLTDAVITTLGPNGRNVIVGHSQGDMHLPQSTKDGVTVAKTIVLEDPIEDLGAQMIKMAAVKTGNNAGDGTTTSTLLAKELIEEGMNQLTQKRNAVSIKRGMEKAAKLVISHLKEKSTDITSEDQIKQVATISANNDKEVGELIATAMDKVGREGVVAVEESKTHETTLETVEGMQFDRGYKSPYFVMIVNKMRGILKCCAVKAPDFGERRTQILEDIAVLTGGTVISKQKGMRLDKITFDHLGTARGVTVGKEKTIIIDGNGSEENITSRLEEIKDQIDRAESNYAVEQLQQRLAKMAGGVAIINVGGFTETEMKEKKDRVDDALHATRAAIDEGIVSGGGNALLQARVNVLNQIDEQKGFSEDKDERIGAEILLNAIEKPFIQILKNAGIEKYHGILSECESNDKGYNIKTRKHVDMIREGIIDPTKVTRTALENAVSVAGTLLITECTIVEDREAVKKYSQENNAPMPPMM